MALGARFYKCDLHLHTPADRSRWLGELIEDWQLAAERYVRRCYETGLEIIAVTEHNFAAKKWLPLLKAAAKQVSGEFGYELVLLPGFEFQADVGKGLHVLGVFDPDADLEIVDRVLSECGVPAERFSSGTPAPSRKRLPEIIQAVQRKRRGRCHGVVICPHCQSNDGIFNNDNISEWLQAAEFTNPDLLCVEVPKAPAAMSTGWQRLFRAGPDCDPAWKRSRPIACIMSSDAKALREDEAPNYIGFRKTWIKMARPSAEALRHAFLAHESRVRLETPALPSCFISRMEVGSCRFFSNRPFTVDFNRQFTAIIGGRGTGKSTILEYLRWALCDQPIDLPEQDPASVELPAYQRKRLSLIEGTLKTQNSPEAYVRVAFVLNGTEHTVTRFVQPERTTLKIGAGAEQAVAESDVGRVLSIQAYSQKQLSTVAVRRDELRRLIETPIQSALVVLNNRITDQARAICDFFRRYWLAQDLDRRCAAATAQIGSIKAQIEGLKQQVANLSTEDQQTLDSHTGFSAEDQVVARIGADSGALSNAVDTALNAIAQLPRDRSVQLQWPQREIIGRMVELIWCATTVVRDALAGARSQLEQTRSTLAAETEAWQRRCDQHQKAYADATARAVAFRDQLGTIDELTRRVSELEKQHDELCGQRSAIRIEVGEEEDLLRGWFDLHKERGDQVEEACKRLNEQSQGDIRVVLRRAADIDRAFAALRERLAGTRARGEWFDSLSQSILSGADPAKEWSALLSELRALAEIAEGEQPTAPLPACPRLTNAGFSVNTIRSIATKLQRSQWLELLATSLQDRPEFFFRVAENEEIQFENASPGQQATALLTVLLHQGGGPLIIDQPEEDLDNAIISRVVEAIWKAKEERQLIFASHNANLVVNGDAELVLHCDYAVANARSAGRIVCQGSIDEESVCGAIKLVMEGGEEAFELRKAKYGF